MQSFSLPKGKLQISRVIQGDHFAPYMFIMVLALSTTTVDREGPILTRRRSTRHAARHLSHLVNVDDIAMFADTIQDTAHLLHKVASASKSTRLFPNPSKTRYMHINTCANHGIHTLDGNQIKKVEDFKYIGSFTNSHHDIQCRKEARPRGPATGESLSTIWPPGNRSIRHCHRGTALYGMTTGEPLYTAWPPGNRSIRHDHRGTALYGMATGEPLYTA